MSLQIRTEDTKIDDSVSKSENYFLAPPGVETPSLNSNKGMEEMSLNLNWRNLTRCFERIFCK